MRRKMGQICLLLFLPMAKTYCNLTQRRPIQSLPFSPNISVPFNPCPVHETRVPLVDGGIPYPDAETATVIVTVTVTVYLFCSHFNPRQSFVVAELRTTYYFVWRRGDAVLSRTKPLGRTSEKP
jgi:hypothetical protein